MQMKKKIVVLILIMILASTPIIAFASEEPNFTYDGYTYDSRGNAVDCPAGFQVERVIDESCMGGTAVQGFNDVCTSKDGSIFLVDTLENRINIVDQDSNFIKSLKVIRDANGKIVVDEKTGEQLVLKAPQGVFFHEKNNELYIADTEAGRIIVLDGSDYTLKKMIGKPDNMAGITEFKPSKIVVDSADRIYVVVQSSYEGIIELNADGTFSRYYGVNAPSVNLLDYFWKSISSDAQKQKMKKTFAPSFNNIALDSEDFIYAVTYDTAAKNMVFRLNSDGKNVLREKGTTLVVGDVHYMNDNGQSKFVDIAVTDFGTYAVLDKEMGRIFIYDYDGQLLNVFGSHGKTKGSMQNPSGIVWLGNKLVVTDSTLKCAYILSPTDYGTALLSASEHYYYGRWEEAFVQFKKILQINSHCEIAYIGIGKNYLMKDKFKKAMYYFKLGNDHTFYSKAYNGYRGEMLKNNFGFVAVIFLLLVSLVVVSEVRYHKKEGQKTS